MLTEPCILDAKSSQPVGSDKSAVDMFVVFAAQLYAAFVRKEEQATCKTPAKIEVCLEFCVHTSQQREC